MNNVAERIKTFDNLAREQAKYQRERSTLSDVSKSFPTFQGRDFSGWLAQITQYNNAAIFEFGGGQKQVAAREIIAYFPKVERYVAYEAKALDPNASDILTDTRFQYIQGGIADFDTKKTGENTFDIAFAHDVATHLPHPFGLLENLHAITKYDGLVFMDGILIDARIANYVIGHWSNLGYTVAHTIRDTYSDLSRRGIVKLDLVLQKTKEKLVTPDVTETPIRDLSLRTYPTLQYEMTPTKERRYAIQAESVILDQSVNIKEHGFVIVGPAQFEDIFYNGNGIGRN